MKKNLLFASLAIFMALVATSCQPKQEEIIPYPENLIGFWAAAPDANQQWYGVDITDTTACLITYESSELIAEELMTLTYDNNNGKGKLISDGKTLNIQVTSDTTFTITMVEGTVIFTKSTKPEEKFSLIGYWKQETDDYVARHLLFYPQDEKDTIYATIIDEENDPEWYSLKGKMYKLVSFDYETLTGNITLVGGKGTELPIIASDLNHLTLNFFGSETSMKKQPRVTNAPKSLQGTWATDSPILLAIGIKLSIVVDKNNQCQINYSKTTPSGVETGSANGKLHYCPRAGRGVAIPIEYDQDNELAFLLEGIDCAIFIAKSATEISVPLANLEMEGEVIFTKQ